jgi:hypothetical protein
MQLDAPNCGPLSPGTAQQTLPSGSPTLQSNGVAQDKRVKPGWAHAVLDEHTGLSPNQPLAFMPGAAQQLVLASQIVPAQGMPGFES